MSVIRSIFHYIFLISNVGSDNILNNPSKISGKYITKSIEGTSSKTVIQEIMNCLANVLSVYMRSRNNGMKPTRSKMLELSIAISFKNK